MSALNVVDSSGWLEYFTDSPRASHFSVAIEDTANLIVPGSTCFRITAPRYGAGGS